MSETAIEPTVVTTPANPFDDSAWVDTPEQTSVQQDTPKVEVPAATTPTEVPQVTTPQVPTVDYNSFVKENFGYDSVEVAKQEIERVKNFKPEEPKYKTVEQLLGDKEEEIANYLSNKKRLERLTTTSLENNTTAASEIIKLSMQQKNPELTAEDAEFMFNEKFNIPSKPSIREDELEDEYSGRLKQWEQTVEKLNRQMIIEAKIAKPELEKLKTELKYPEINTTPIQAEPTQEELDKLKAIRDGYVSTLNEDYKKFEGFNTPYKDEAVEFTVPFTVSDEEKDSLKVQLENFDSDSFIGERWFTKEGKPNVQQMMADVYLLTNRDKIFQKIANEAGSKRFELHVKGTSNLTVDGKTPQGTFSPDNKSNEEKQKDAIWDA